MQKVIEARSVVRSFGDRRAVDGVDLAIDAGSIVGLIGPNGAGKTTLLRALLGLTAVEGSVRVLGRDPLRERSVLMERVCFIADTAVLPKWMRVGHLLEFVAGVHPSFDRARADEFLGRTEVRATSRVGELSKGMNVQVHLAIAMAIDARVLILDEPTLGLDILFRKRFFEQLLNDYFDEERTIVISTHQVEEVEHILSHVLFMDHGRIVLEQAMAEFEERFVELHAVGDALAEARAIPHVGSRNILGGRALIFEDVPRARLAPLGELRTPSISDLFMAKVRGSGT